MTPAPIALRILLAEDNEVNQHVASAMLRKRGHSLDVVGDGQQAVDAVRSGRYDVVMMDLHMPVMDGQHATRAIRSLPGTGGLAIVAVTADASITEREQCLAMGMDDYLTKPFKSHALFETLEAAVTRRRTADSVAHTPVIDIAGFRATMRDAGVEDAVDQILDTFIAGAPGRGAAVAEALRSGDGGRIQFEAHAFKSSAAMIGAHALAADLLAIELAGRDGRIDDARALDGAVRNGTAAVLAHLQTSRTRPVLA